MLEKQTLAIIAPETSAQMLLHGSLMLVLPVDDQYIEALLVEELTL